MYTIGLLVCIIGVKSLKGGPNVFSSEKRKREEETETHWKNQWETGSLRKY